MPFFKRRFSRRPAAKTSLAKLEKKVNRIQKATNAQMHMMNNTITDATLDVAGVVFYMSTIAQGDDDADRSGAAIANCRLDFRYTMATTADTFCRIIVFQDNNLDATAPLVLDVLQTATIDSQYNVPNTVNKRFNIIYDVLHKLVNGTETDLQTTFKAIRRKLNNIHFTGNDALAASSSKGGLWCIAVPAVDEVVSFTMPYSIHFQP